MAKADEEGLNCNPDDWEQQNADKKFDRQQWGPRTQINHRVTMGDCVNAATARGGDFRFFLRVRRAWRLTVFFVFATALAQFSRSNATHVFFVF